MTAAHAPSSMDEILAEIEQLAAAYLEMVDDIGPNREHEVALNRAVEHAVARREIRLRAAAHDPTPRPGERPEDRRP